MSDFSNNLKAQRKRAQLSQEMLAQKLSVTRQTVSSWERSNSYPDLEQLVRLADALNITPNDLLYPSERRNRPVENWLLEYPLFRYVFRAVLLFGGLLGLWKGSQGYAPAPNVSAWHFVFKDALSVWVPAFLIALVFLAFDQIICLLLEQNASWPEQSPPPANAEGGKLFIPQRRCQRQWRLPGPPTAGTAPPSRQNGW